MSNSESKAVLVCVDYLCAFVNQGGINIFIFIHRITVASKT